MNRPDIREPRSGTDRTHRMEDDFKLTERELAVARRAAAIAVEEMANTFYRQVGKTVIQRIIIYIGLVGLGWATARGWITFPKG